MKLLQGQTGVLVLPLFLPAALVSPVRFGGLLLDPTYLQAAKYGGFETVFYSGNYNSSILEYDFEHRGTVTLGEIATSLFGQVPAPQYQGAVILVNGNEDGVFCEDGPVQALAGVTANCSKGFSAGVRESFPAASLFEFYETDKTGHSLNNHDTAQESFKAAHDLLAQAGF